LSESSFKFAARALSRHTGLSGDVFVNYYQSGLPSIAGIWGAGANGSVYQRIGPFNASLSAGISTYDGQSTPGTTTTADSSDDYTIQTQFALGYRF